MPTARRRTSTTSEADYEGIVIEESLEDRSVLHVIEIVSTRVEPITPAHRTPWLSQWTLHTVHVPADRAEAVAEALSKAFDSAHPASWYADFKNDEHHYVIYKDRVFFIDRRNRRQYDEAVTYGVERGLPEHQADFVALIED
jgi:hypothetical protein